MTANNSHAWLWTDRLISASKVLKLMNLKSLLSREAAFFLRLWDEHWHFFFSPDKTVALFHCSTVISGEKKKIATTAIMDVYKF